MDGTTNFVHEFSPDSGIGRIDIQEQSSGWRDSLPLCVKTLVSGRGIAATMNGAPIRTSTSKLGSCLSDGLFQRANADIKKPLRNLEIV